MTWREIKNMCDFVLDNAIYEKTDQMACPMPNYSGSLDALRKVEEMLTPEQRADQIAVLAVNISIPIKSEPPRVYVAADGSIPSDKALSPELYVKWGIYKALQFTARQRAEALLWVLTQEDGANA